jgi:predicted nucleotidyltransferase
MSGAHTSSRDTPSRLETAPQHRPVHSHQMSRVWTQKEVELNHEELAKKERERKKAEAQLESKHNLDVLFYDQVSTLYAILLVYQ